jgi:hypothetical protein
MRILIENVDVLQEDRVISNKNILIEEDKIVEISDKKEFENIDYRIDGKNRLLCQDL